jgi:hypothetical protein
MPYHILIISSFFFSLYPFISYTPFNFTMSTNTGSPGSPALARWVSSSLDKSFFWVCALSRDDLWEMGKPAINGCDFIGIWKGMSSRNVMFIFWGRHMDLTWTSAWLWSRFKGIILGATHGIWGFNQPRDPWGCNHCIVVPWRKLIQNNLEKQWFRKWSTIYIWWGFPHLC